MKVRMMNNSIEFAGMWCGNDLREMEKDDLIKVILYLSKREREAWKELRDAYDHMDWNSYLLRGPGKRI
jgi:hypothetical protein